MKRRKLPDCNNEIIYWEKGNRFIAGVDEAGRGPLAGPVVASSVILPEYFINEYQIDDSKKLTKEQRLNLYLIIQKKALSIGVSIVPEYLIDTLNIYNATILAMEQSIDALNIKPDIVLVDGMDLKKINCIKIIKGDEKSVSIAAASIVAKVIRDNIMLSYHYKFPYYGFNTNSGYPTKFHKIAIKKMGILPIHRKSFAPIKNLL